MPFWGSRSGQAPADQPVVESALLNTDVESALETWHAMERDNHTASKRRQALQEELTRRLQRVIGSLLRLIDVQEGNDDASLSVTGRLLRLESWRYGITLERSDPSRRDSDSPASNDTFYVTASTNIEVCTGEGREAPDFVEDEALTQAAQEYAVALEEEHASDESLMQAKAAALRALQLLKNTWIQADSSEGGMASKEPYLLPGVHVGLVKDVVGNSHGYGFDLLLQLLDRTLRRLNVDHGHRVDIYDARITWPS